jgi:hypothetical protein
MAINSGKAVVVYERTSNITITMAMAMAMAIRESFEAVSLLQKPGTNTLAKTAKIRFRMLT